MKRKEEDEKKVRRKGKNTWELEWAHIDRMVHCNFRKFKNIVCAIIGGPGRLFDTYMYYLAFGSQSSHATNWFLSPLALQETGTWRYADRIAVKYQYLGLINASIAYALPLGVARW